MNGRGSAASAAPALDRRGVRMADRAADDTASGSADTPAPLTADELRRLIGETALRGAKGRGNGLLAPSDEACVELADLVNHWQRIYDRARRDARDAETIHRAERARAALAAEIPALLEMTAALDDRDPFKAGAARRIRAAAIALADFALPQPPIYRAPGVPDRESPDWRWIARVLREDFARHLGNLGARDDGPAGRLLAAILARAFGERVSPARVAKFLRDTNDKIT